MPALYRLGLVEAEESSYLPHSDATSSERGDPPGDALYQWMIEELSKSYELGLYSSRHVELDEEDEELVCHREELLLWDGSSVMNRDIRVFQSEKRVKAPYVPGSSV